MGEWCFVLICTTGLCDITSLTIINLSSRSTKVVTASANANVATVLGSILAQWGGGGADEAVLKYLKKSLLELFDFKFLLFVVPFL
jgi:hypothetical protein